MTESMTAEGLITRKLIRKTLKISADGRLNTRSSKVRRMMRNNSPRIISNLPEATVPQPRDRRMTSL